MLTYAAKERESVCVCVGERYAERERERERERALLASALTKERAAQRRAGLVRDWHSLVQYLASVLTKEYAAQRRMRLDQTKSLVG
jgi:hypothetical protein